MFDPDATRDPQSNQTTRRLFLAGGAAIAVAALVLKLRGSNVEASGVIHGTPGQVTIVNFNNDGTKLGEQTVDKILKSDGDWLQQLGKNSYQIARLADTEVPGFGVSLHEHAKGVYRCVCCDTALFSSATKFESGTGWPSFWAPIAKENIVEKTDLSMGVSRTEVQCIRCEAHLGHVFNDGPLPTGLRYCMNSASMKFAKA